MSAVGRGIVLRQLDRLFGEGTLTGLGDGQLLERYLTRRDEDAFEALVDLHGPMVLGLCRRMLRDPRDIEDAFQATFLVLVRKAPAIRDRSLLSSWLYGVAFRVARRARTRTLRRRDREATVGELEFAAEPESTPQPDFDPTLDQELSRLPEKYRAPLILCYLRGKTHDQAAAELRCPVGTVRSRLARGRDLLRKRLTRRGFAPAAMAAVLRGDATLAARLLVTPVPPPLAAATACAALRFGSSHILSASASSLALAQGVLTTMKLTQIKWIGLAVLATSLSAGSVVAVRHAGAQTPEAAAAGGAVPLVQDEQQPVSSPTTEGRLKSLEDKIDQLMNRLDAPSATSNPGAGPLRPNQPPSRNDPRHSTQAPPTTTNPVRELEAQLKLELEAFNRIDSLYRRGAIAFDEREQARGKILITSARLEAVDDEIADEIERLKLELRRKNKEREKDEAQTEIARAKAALNKRLNVRKPGMVAAEEVAKDEGALKLAVAQVGITEVEISEVTLRIQQLQRRHDRVKQVVLLAERVKKDSSPPAPAAR